MFAGKSSYDSDCPNLTVTASEKVLVPGGETVDFSSSTDRLEIGDTASEESQVLKDVESLTMEDHQTVEDEVKQDTELVLLDTKSVGRNEVKPRFVSPPGTGQKIYEIDPSLTGFCHHLDYRYAQYKRMREEIDKYEGGLEVFSRGYEKLGFTRSETGITYREWAPGAKVCFILVILCGLMFSLMYLVWTKSLSGSQSFGHGDTVLLSVKFICFVILPLFAEKQHIFLDFGNRIRFLVS
uniref:1 4-alpha-glucan-branching enzyme 1ic/amyloplastic isoform X2 n=1 Tax=Rhizophora mucronata TaxID=61149 RepID=A0A2P2M6T1_RHIMU